MKLYLKVEKVTETAGRDEREMALSVVTPRHLDIMLDRSAEEDEAWDKAYTALDPGLFIKPHESGGATGDGLIYASTRNAEIRPGDFIRVDAEVVTKAAVMDEIGVTSAA